jgi:hypothetical protein
MRTINKLSVAVTLALISLAPLACLADSEASLEASGESGASNKQESFAGTQNNREAQNRPSSEAVHSSESQSTVEAGRPRADNVSRLAGSQALIDAQAAARNKSAGHTPTAKVTNYSSHPRARVSNYRRGYMVNTIQQAARTK